MAEAMVFAVYMPPHAPAPGHAVAHDCLPLLLGDGVGDELAVALEGGDDVQLLAILMAGADGSAIDHQLGRLSLPMAMRHPGMFLSQPGMETLASYHWAPITVSMESAIRSRDCSE